MSAEQQRMSPTFLPHQLNINVHAFTSMAPY